MDALRSRQSLSAPWRPPPETATVCDGLLAGALSTGMETSDERSDRFRPIRCTGAYSRRNPPEPPAWSVVGCHAVLSGRRPGRVPRRTSGAPASACCRKHGRPTASHPSDGVPDTDAPTASPSALTWTTHHRPRAARADRERRIHVARRLTGPAGEGRAGRGRRAGVRRLRPRLPAVRLGADQLAGRPGRGRRHRLRRQPCTAAQRAGPRPALRALASDAIRGALERHFGVQLAFQNCHRVAVFRPSSANKKRYERFTSVREQLLNQSDELRDC